MTKFNTIPECLDFIIDKTCYDEFYPTAIQKRVKMCTLDDLYGVLCEYVNKKKINVLFEIICPHCLETVSKHEYYADIPNYSLCENCDNQIERFDNVHVKYKINRRLL